MEQHQAWSRTAACACARHHLVATVEYILDSKSITSTDDVQQTEELVRSYVSSASIVINDINALVALSHASRTGISRFSSSAAGDIIDKLTVSPAEWEWGDVIDGWSYDVELAPKINLRSKTVRGPLHSPGVTVVKDAPTEVNWNPVQFIPVEVIGRKECRPGTNDAGSNNTKYLWKTTWADVLRPGDELAQWERDAKKCDVRQLIRTPSGGVLVQYFWTWQREDDSDPAMIAAYKGIVASKPQRQHRVKRVRVKEPRDVTCRWCPHQCQERHMDVHASNEHPRVSTVTAIRQQYEDAPEEEKIWDDMMALGFLRRMSWHKQNELDAGFSMAMTRKYFVNKAVVEGVIVEQTMISGKEDIIKVTIEDPAVLDKWMGSQWWWKQMMDPKGNWLRAFVMFGDREVMTPEKDKEGKPVFRKVVDKIVLSHTVKTDVYHGRAYKSAKVDVWFRRTRGSLLPALPTA